MHPLSEDLHLYDSVTIVERLHDADREAVLAVERVLPQVARAADWLAETFEAGGRVLYVGAGTSGRLGALDAAELPPTFGIPRARALAIIAGGPKALVSAVEGAEDDEEDAVRQVRRRRVSRRDLVVGISASGSTPFVRAALKEARSAGARTVLVCTCEKPRARADLVIAPQTGPELIAGSTRMKAGTATKLVLNAISTTAMILLGKVFRGRMIDVQPTNAKLRARALRIVRELTGASQREATLALKRSNGDVRRAVEAELERICGVETEAAPNSRAKKKRETR